MIKALFSGSFDPPTYGHLNIIERAAMLFNELDIVIAINTAKTYLLSEQERLDLLTELTREWKNTTVHLHSGLIVDYARATEAHVLIRGIRNFSDFSYEYDLALLNKGLNENIETLFLPTDPQFFVLKSSTIKELASFGGDVSKMVPPIVEKMLNEKYSK